MIDEETEVTASNTITENSPAQVTRLTLKEFLESRPPGGACSISDLWHWEKTGTSNTPYLNKPQLMLHCSHKDCDGPRYYRCTTQYTRLNEEENSLFLDYVCSNCQKTYKRFSIFVSIAPKIAAQINQGKCEKYGEVPAFGPPTPPRLLRLFGSDKDVFLKGRRSEIQGLGIGAFAYYRRIVENHKDDIFSEIIKVCEKIGSTPEVISLLNTAKREVQFSSALEKAKEAIPAALLINGHNPLTLLHSALSSGIHAKDDAECLELANDIRIVMSELANRLGQALNDEKELSAAVNRLLASKQKKPI
jgi:hypothetical protein